MFTHLLLGLRTEELCMEKGKLLGIGRTAEVYEWGKDKVLKLYFKDISENWINNEARIGNIVHETGVASPAVFDIVDINGRKGVIFERIYGRSIYKNIEFEPWKVEYFAKEMARLQFKMHKCSTDKLPSQKEKLRIAINASSEILGDRGRKILDYLDRLPEDTRVCHGDLHFDNIIVSKNHLVPIDWNAAYRGNPLGDVARTGLVFSLPTMPPGTWGIMIMQAGLTRWIPLWVYLNEYCRLAKIKLQSIDAWILPVAAAKLKDQILGERVLLMNMVNKYISKYNL